MPVSARLILNEDGTITAMTGKVEEGQGARAELTQAAAEELRVPLERIQLIMADTDLVPDDGITAGSRTTPRNVPAMRQGAAAARELLTALAARSGASTPRPRGPRRCDLEPTRRTMTYADLATSRTRRRSSAGDPARVTLTPVRGWKVLGSPCRGRTRATWSPARTGSPRTWCAPECSTAGSCAPLLRRHAESLDLSAAEAMKDVVVVREGVRRLRRADLFRRRRRSKRSRGPRRGSRRPQPVSSEKLFEHLRAKARRGEARTDEKAPWRRPSGASRVLAETYRVAYIQHAPMEPRAAVAEWNDGSLTVWAAATALRRAADLAGASASRATGSA